MYIILRLNYYGILTTSINPTKPLDRGVCLPISIGQAEELIVETTNKRGRTCNNKTISDIIQQLYTCMGDFNHKLNMDWNSQHLL